MALFEDPLTADLPSRLEREEEEAEAVAGAVGMGEAPLMLFSPATRALLPTISTLVVAVSPVACALLRSALKKLGSPPLAGAAILPEVRLAGNTAASCPPAPGDTGCFFFVVGGGSTLLALAQFPDLPDGRTPALAAALVGSVPPGASVVALASIPGHALAGPGGAAAVALASGPGAALAVETPQFTGAVPCRAPEGPPPLPPGAAVTGLAAAVGALATSQGRRGAVGVGVDTSAGAPPASGLIGVAGGMAALLARAGVETEVVEAVKGGVGEAAAELGAADKVAARSAVYF